MLYLNCAVNTVWPLTWEDLMWSFARAFDISVFMLNILNAVDNQTTLSDYCDQIFSIIF